MRFKKREEGKSKNKRHTWYSTVQYNVHRRIKIEGKERPKETIRKKRKYRRGRGRKRRESKEEGGKGKERK